ncbi:protein GAST1-like [Lycium ferocissimum]|uniref:protein GAST1-like n=1 Tax=Lycium ferocissimum TaxID=112874 RepID=UPI0028164B10|nr:protein GAST1-like [Lycium ferocissimum]
MEKKFSLVLILPLLIMILLVGTHAKIVTETPAPQPQPPKTSPMNGTTPGSLHPQECLPKCTYRCSKTQYRKPCMFFCQKCCVKCLCVPPGTYGNKQFCPCYNNWKTKRGGPKCP